MDSKKIPATVGERNAGANKKAGYNLSKPTENVKPAKSAAFENLKIKLRRENRNLYYDARLFQGAHYWERGFLSCVMAGADIPDAVTPECFRMPFNRVIFEALCSIKHKPDSVLCGKYDLLVSLLKATGKLDSAGGEAYALEIRDMIGVPGAVYAFAVKIIELKAGVAV